MGSNGSITAFLRDSLDYPEAGELRQLEALGGQTIGGARFLHQLSDARALLEHWMPLAFLPAAESADLWGLHLRPSDVQQHRLAFLAGPAPGEFEEVAATPGQAAYLALLGEEGYLNHGEQRPDLPGAIAAANKVFGADFYATGRHGGFHSGDEVLAMNQVFTGTPASLYAEATMADDPADALPFWERGIALSTGTLELHAGAARALLALGRREEAAREAARSLDCYHHTAHFVDLDDWLEEARPLLDEFPQLFSEDATWQLREPDPRKWAARPAQLLAQGHPARAEKLLNDVCHAIGDYDSALPAFRQIYTALSWDWALALCDLRS